MAHDIGLRPNLYAHAVLIYIKTSSGMRRTEQQIYSSWVESPS